MSEQIKIINITIELCGMLLCLLGIAAVCIGAKMDKKTSKYFLAIFLCLMFYISSNIFGLLFKGQKSDLGFYAVRISNFCEFFFGYLLSLIFTLYIIYCVDKTRSRKKLRIVIFAFFFVQVLLLIISQFTNMYYYFDSSNVYTRGDYFWLSQIVGIVSIIINVVIIVKNHKKLSKKEKNALGIYLLLPAVAITIQMFYYGLFLTLFAEIIAAFAMFMFILEDQTEKYCEKERENSDMRVAIMMSQIQPHFLYNTLTSIYCLCDKDARAAKQAISQFSTYLRGNLESIRRETPILFDDELKHVESYLALEKMRFEDELDVVYDIQARNFFVPALTVQPLVENAVKYGVGDAIDGGTVKISSRELPECYEIDISDDGVGFNPDDIVNDGEFHIGIENVRSRLELMCKGTLEIQSELGKGTTVIVKIPKEMP